MATFDAMSEDYEEILVCGKPVLFTGARIARETVPDELYFYEVRYDDDNKGDPVEIAPRIWVNYFGCILSIEPMALNEKGFLEIEPDTDWNFSGAGDSRSVKEYLEVYLPGKAGEKDASRSI